MSDKLCGCRALYALHSTGASCDIEYCPLHTAAPKLLAACEEVLPILFTGRRREMLIQAIAAAKEGR